MQYKSSEGRMNLRDKINQEVQHELGKNMIPNPGFGKYSLVKSKKKSVVVEKEKLYEDNFDLRNRIKELQDMNLKLKTQLLVAEKEKDEIFNIAEDQVFHQKLPQRSQSGVHKIIPTNIHENKNNILLLKEKQNFLTYKKLVREKQNEIQKLQMENANLKRTMKFTRMNELLTENNELIDETKRLKMQMLQLKSYNEQTIADYVSKIENLKKQLQYERGGEKRNGMQLKKQMEMVNQLKQKLRQAQLKKVDTEKRLNRQLKALKIGEKGDQGSKNLHENYGKECDKLDCLQSRNDKAQLKKKVEQLQKEIMRLNHELLDEKKKVLQQLFQYKRLESAHKKAQAEYKIKSAVQHQHIEPKSPKKQQKHSQKQKSQIKNDSKLQQSPKTKKNEKQRKGQVSEYLQELVNTDQEHYSSIKAQDLNESIQAEPQNNKSDIKVEKKQGSIYKQSDGQYQQIQIQDGKSPKPKHKQEKIQKNQKQDKKLDKIQQKKQSVQKTQKTRNDKSIQKSIITEKVDIDPQHTQQHGRKDQEHQRAELKLIKKTLTYKFMAQRYTYDQVSVLVQQSQKKEFSVTEIMNVFSDEPFLLSEEDIQTMVIYLFESDNLTGEETVSTKNFLRKMKKFIGKVKPINEQLQNQRMKKLISIVKADEKGKSKIRNYCKKFELGEGLISKDIFVAAMKEIKVKDELLQTALAQIVYISKDINHLNYEQFLNRLTETER